MIEESALPDQGHARDVGIPNERAETQKGKRQRLFQIEEVSRSKLKIQLKKAQLHPANQNLQSSFIITCKQKDNKRSRK